MSLDSTCIICQNDLQIACTTNCGHTTCHECVIKYFVVEGKSTCILCREDDPKFAFYAFQPDAKENSETCNYKGKVGNKNFFFKSKSIHGKVEKLMWYKCPLDESRFKSFKPFNDHLKSHDKYIKACHLCGQSKHLLPSQIQTFKSVKSYEKHMKHGDPKSGFEGHPACMFCEKERFYSDDELKKHMDKSIHASCFICKKIPSIPERQCWFKNSIDLNSHLKKSHYSCSSDECPLIAFETKAELEFHNIEKHGKIHPDFAFFNEDESNIIRNTHSSQTTNEKTTFADKSESAMRKLRFKERARHYWGHDKETMDLFELTNNCFIDKEISVDELCDIYTKMFDHESNKIEVENKISLLLKNFADYVKDDEELCKILLSKSKSLDHMPQSKSFNINKQKKLPSLAVKNNKISTLSDSFVNNELNNSMSSLNIDKKVPTLPTLPGSTNSSLFNNSQFYNVNTTSKPPSKKTLPTLSSLKSSQSPLFNKPVQKKNVISGAGRTFVDSKTSHSSGNSVPGMNAWNNKVNVTPETPLTDIYPGYVSTKSLQVVPNNNGPTKTQVIQHAKVDRLPGLPTLKAVQSDRTKNVKLRIKQKNNKNANAVDMTSDYQERLNAIRNKTKKLEEKDLLKTWANI
ncbi:uncharacterized protein HGUI_02505 [Hanseniaspora guilliermondii]|uniref:RING-type domain-containing protein n=1 Tax=Hanseniaspora guilliermondii TaxID=56406 RepID=A0A1L0CPA8_9ASCO|nr:uncharacterized protein HGUI_02505 [Hanseniaspora guilliermondii]